MTFRISFIATAPPDDLRPPVTTAETRAVCRLMSALAGTLEIEHREGRTHHPMRSRVHRAVSECQRYSGHEVMRRTPVGGEAT